MFNSVMLLTEGTIFLFVYFRTLMQGGTAKGDNQEENGEQMDWCHQQPQGTQYNAMTHSVGFLGIILEVCVLTILKLKACSF